MNKLINGECLEEMDKLIAEGIKVDAIITDPPYGIDFEQWDLLHHNTNSALLKDSGFKKRGKPINGWSKADKNISKEYYDFCLKFGERAFKLLKQGSPLIIFNSRRFIHRLNSAIEDSGFSIRDILIWEKTKAHSKAQKIEKVLNKRGIIREDLHNYRIGNLKPMYEPFVWAIKGYKGTLTDCVLNNGVGGFFNGDISDIKSNIFNYDIDKKTIHPTQKPIALMEDIINTFTMDGQVILDPFMGSGTTGVACQNTNRDFIGIELDETYFNIAKQRING